MKETCTIYQTVDFIARKWTLLILLELYKTQGKKRYQELKNSLPNITPKILSTRLKELEHQDLIKKHVDASEFPVKCEYALSESGRDFIRIIKDIKRWALMWKIQNKDCQHQQCKDCEL